MKPKSRDSIYLVGYETEQILGAKLPSNRQVLSVLFYNMRNVYRDLRRSLKLVIQEVAIFYEKSGIPMRKESNAMDKLESLYNRWRKLDKNKKREKGKQKENEESFKNSLDDLFDVAHANAFSDMSSESKAFLIAQREHGRKGCLMGVDENQTQKEKRIAERLEKEGERKRKYELSKRGKSVLNESRSESNSSLRIA